MVSWGIETDCHWTKKGPCYSLSSWRRVHWKLQEGCTKCFRKPVQREAISIPVERTSSIQEIFFMSKRLQVRMRNGGTLCDLFLSEWSVVQNNFAKKFFVTMKTCVYDSKFGGLVMKVAFNCCAASKTNPWKLLLLTHVFNIRSLILIGFGSWRTVVSTRTAFLKRLICISN